MFEALADNPDFEYLIVDSTIVHATSTPAAQKEGLKNKARQVQAWIERGVLGSMRSNMAGNLCCG